MIVERASLVSVIIHIIKTISIENIYITLAYYCICIICIIDNIYIYIYISGLLKVLMCDCITNAINLMIILDSGYSLDMKELTYAIIINFILYFDWF